MVVAVTFYRYYKKKAKGEVNYRWRTRCPELVDKIVKHRTKVFTGQLIHAVGVDRGVVSRRRLRSTLRRR